MDLSPNFQITPSSKSLPKGLSLAAWQHAVQRAARVWDSAEVECSARHVVVLPAASVRIARQDGQNVIVFRGQRWCHNARCSAHSTFRRQIAAVTQTYPEGARGLEVVEADVQLNAVIFDWGAAAPGSAVPFSSLHAVLVHEIGHMLGLEDECGASIYHGPIAGNCTLQAKSSVMYAPAGNETLSESDVIQLCQLYPALSFAEGASSAAQAPLVTELGLGLAAALLATLVLSAAARWRRGVIW